MSKFCIHVTLCCIALCCVALSYVKCDVKEFKAFHMLFNNTGIKNFTGHYLTFGHARKDKVK